MLRKAEQPAAHDTASGGPPSWRDWKLSSIFLLLTIACTFLDILAHWRYAPFLGTIFLCVYFFRERARLMVNAKILIVVCLGLSLYAVSRTDALQNLQVATSRMIYFPAFVALLSLLRAAASESSTVAVAGRFLISQPPRRRYLALTFGSHLFGFLFNVGGFALLMDMVKRANTLQAAGGDEQVVELRERRMTLAVIRGFSCMPFWAPLGVALNLLLVVMPDLSWSAIAPWGVVCAIAFMMLGWLFDQIEAPRMRRRLDRETVAGGGRAVVWLVGHVFLLAGSAIMIEEVFSLAFQYVLLIVVPLYSLAWLTIGNIKKHGEKPLRRGLFVIKSKGVDHFPGYVNEIAMFATSGFMGAILMAVIPAAALQNLIAGIAVPVGVFAAGVAGAIFLLGLVGINPIVSASVLAGTLSGLAIPGLSAPYLALAIAGGWTCVIGFSPMMSSLVMGAALIGRPPTLVGVIWNGRFCLASIVLWMLVLQVIPL